MALRKYTAGEDRVAAAASGGVDRERQDDTASVPTKRR
jgi:hypothetical protein